MTYTIRKSRDGKYIHLKVKGPTTRESAMAHNIEAHALGRKLGINRYLVDLTESRNVESVIDNYEFAYKDMKTPQVDPAARVAVLVSPGDHSHDFIETVARNAGLDMTLFTNQEQARRHLLAD